MRACGTDYELVVADEDEVVLAVVLVVEEPDRLE